MMLPIFNRVCDLIWEYRRPILGTGESNPVGSPGGRGGLSRNYRPPLCTPLYHESLFLSPPHLMPHPNLYTPLSDNVTKF